MANSKRLSPLREQLDELAARIKDALGIRTDVVSRRAIKARYWEIIQGELVDVP